MAYKVAAVLSGRTVQTEETLRAAGHRRPSLWYLEGRRGRHVESADWRGSLACVSDVARVGDALGFVYILC